MNRKVAIVGGGMAGLAAAVYLARAGCSVTLFERRRQLGGRAITHLRHGYRFNLGPHAVFGGGAGATVYRELGIPVRGARVPLAGLALDGGSHRLLPAGPFSTLFTRALGAKGKAEAAKLALRLSFTDPQRSADLTAAEWLDGNVSDARLRVLVGALMRLTTYSAAPEKQSAAVALRQLRIAQRGVVYVHEGWQKLVDALHSHAVTAGVNFVTSSHVVGVDHDGDVVRGVELGELELDDSNDTLAVALPQSVGDRSSTRIPADCVLLAVDPATAGALTGGAVPLGHPEPVRMSCLDVALARLPQPKRTFAVGLDRAVYYSAHSRWAQLTPKGGALLHAAAYHANGAVPGEAELENLLDEMQPGWRDALVHRRYLPSMVVSNALVQPGVARPAVKTQLRGLYLAGDWVGDEGILSDASLASARAAARAILAGG